MMPNARDIIQSKETVTVNDFFPNLWLVYGYLMHMNLSMLINVTKNTEASLDSMDIVPAILQVIPDLQVSACIGK